MALTVNQGWLHALAHLKMVSTAFSAEEVRSANDIQSHITTFHNWHWTLTAATNIAVTLASGQDYSMAAGDQNKVLDIADANLLSGSTQYPALGTRSHPILARTSDTGRPTAVGLISATQVRLWPAPDASYTLQWRYFARPVTFTANSESYQCPDAFMNVILEGNVWKVLQLADDDRAQAQYDKFVKLLSELRRAELRTMGRVRN